MKYTILRGVAIETEWLQLHPALQARLEIGCPQCGGDWQVVGNDPKRLPNSLITCAGDDRSCKIGRAVYSVRLQFDENPWRKGPMEEGKLIRRRRQVAESRRKHYWRKKAEKQGLNVNIQPATEPCKC